MQSNVVSLQHPCGAQVMLIGTQHVSVIHGSQAGTAVERLQPSRVVLELDEVRKHYAAVL
jgi:pheromone shutdown protein TraB